MNALPHVARASGKIEWYTPIWLLDEVRYVMGDIDLDPASCAEANRVVKAKKYFSLDDSGLDKEWRGRVYMNPPYARKLIDAFAFKFAEERIAGNVREACVVVNNATDTEWFQLMAVCCNRMCILKGRVSFWSPGTASKKGLQGQVVLYTGPHLDEFNRRFGEHGLVYELHNGRLGGVAQHLLNKFEFGEAFQRGLAVRSALKPM